MNNENSNLSIEEQQQLEQIQKATVMINQFAESCPGHAIIATAGGFVFGALMGLFLSSFEYSSFSTPPQLLVQPSLVASQSTNSTTNTTTNTNLSNQKIIEQEALPLRQQIKIAVRDTVRKSHSMAKQFAMVGALYSSTECVIESYRAKHDIYNSVSAGCASGALLAARGGPQSALVGCAGFAAFSAAIDYFIENHYSPHSS